MSEEYETFYGTIWKTGSGHVITVPEKIRKYAGFNNGDAVKVTIKKHQIIEEIED